MNEAAGIWTSRQISSSAAQPGGRRPFIADSRLRYKFSPLVFRCEQTGNETGFVPGNSILPVSNIPSMLRTHLHIFVALA